MLSFILHQILSLRTKSVSIIFIITIFTILLSVFVFISKNTIGALEYYSPHMVDSSRVTFASKTSIFDILSRSGWWIDSDEVLRIQKDELFSRTRLFTFIDTNIVGGFDIFTFHLDTDIPVFWIEDSAWDISGFGISPSMIHYYNLELAGSHPMFPSLDASFLKGKLVSLTFGASKIFQVSTPSSSPLRGSIVSIDSDYPWFGIVAPLSQIEPKLHEIWNIPRQPYKIIAYMKDPTQRSIIEEKYSKLQPVFDKDLIDKQESQFRAIQLSIFAVGWFFSLIVIALLFILFVWFYREKESIFRLLRVYGIWFPYRQFILYGETVIFMIFGNTLAILSLFVSQSFLIERFSWFLRLHGILVPILSNSFSDTLLVCAISCILITWITFFTSRRA